MYIKLRYRGRLRQPSDAYQLIQEVQDICAANAWNYKVWDEDWSLPSSLEMSFTGTAMNFTGHAPLKGITLNVGDAETAWLTFQPDGTLQSFFTLVNPLFIGNDEDFPWQRVKTGNDGPQTHIALCKLFHYLSDKYFSVFEVQDESGYWDSGNDEQFSFWLRDTEIATRQLTEELELIRTNTAWSEAEREEAVKRLVADMRDRLKAGGAG